MLLERIGVGGGPMVEDPRVSDDVNVVDASLVKME
jgi:hypothetical protein